MGIRKLWWSSLLPMLGAPCAGFEEANRRIADVSVPTLLYRAAKKLALTTQE